MPFGNNGYVLKRKLIRSAQLIPRTNRAGMKHAVERKVNTALANAYRIVKLLCVLLRTPGDTPAG